MAFKIKYKITNNKIELNTLSIKKKMSIHERAVLPENRHCSLAALEDVSLCEVHYNNIIGCRKIKEEQIWVIRGKKTKVKGNNRKRLSLVQRRNGN